MLPCHTGIPTERVPGSPIQDSGASCAAADALYPSAPRFVCAPVKRAHNTAAARRHTLQHRLSARLAWTMAGFPTPAGHTRDERHIGGRRGRKKTTQPPANAVMPPGQCERIVQKPNPAVPTSDECDGSCAELASQWRTPTATCGVAARDKSSSCASDSRLPRASHVTRRNGLNRLAPVVLCPVANVSSVVKVHRQNVSCILLPAS